MKRRDFIKAFGKGVGAVAAAPLLARAGGVGNDAVLKSGVAIRVRPEVVMSATSPSCTLLTPDEITRQALRLMHEKLRGE